MSDLTGVIPITATPFDAEGRLDEDSIGAELRDILERSKIL